MAVPPASPDNMATPNHPETSQRFKLLRSLIRNPQLRRRLLLTFATIALLVVAALSALARLYTVMPVDVWFTRELQENQYNLLSQIMYWVSLLGYTPWSAITVALGTLLVGLLLGWRDGAYLLGITVGQGLINALIKRTIGRPRPISDLVEIFVSVEGYSFPSGHVMFYTVFFGFLIFLIFARMPKTRWRWLLAAPPALLVLLVGPSRIILGAHWLSDVSAAYLLGLVILIAAIEGYLRLLAPASPAQQTGLMRTIDEQRETQPR